MIWFKEDDRLWDAAFCSPRPYLGSNSETLVFICKSARRHNSELQRRHLDRREDLESRRVKT
jgi:hypothetical protein